MHVRLAALTDKGVAKPGNEDRVFIADGVLSSGCCAGESGLPAVVAVFDGVSQSGHGGRAASLAARSLVGACGAEDDERGAAEICDATLGRLAASSEDMRTESAAAGLPIGMATTVAGLAIGADTSFAVFHAGDSRVYRLRGGFLSCRTADHTPVQLLLDAGAPQAVVEQARASQAHVISRALGFAEGADAVEVSQGGAACHVGDMYLLCSDGLTDGLSDDQIEAVLNASGELSEKARLLFEGAVRGGSTDNVSLALVELCEGPAETTGVMGEYDG